MSFTTIELINKLLVIKEKMANSPLVKDLPANIQELVLENQQLQLIQPDPEKNLASSFKWYESKQGYDFWLKICEDFKAKKPEPQSSKFNPGEEVVVFDQQCNSWLKGTFIGMDGVLFMVKIKNEIKTYTRCRKQPDREEENVFINGLKHSSAAHLAEGLLKYPCLEILDGCTPENRPDLEGRAFFIKPGYVVETGPACGGTFISIHRK